MDALNSVLERIARSADHPEGYSKLFLDLVPASGVAVSTIGNFLGNETLSASSSQAERIDEFQFDLGEGPCWDAMWTRRPVLQPDIFERRDRWPAFSKAMVSERVSSIFAFPLTVGSLRIGAVDIYSLEPLSLSHGQSRDVSVLAEVAGKYVLRYALDNLHLDQDIREPSTRRFPRRVVHQATGMIMAQLGLSADDATLVMQGHAFASSQSVLELAQKIVDRVVDFSDPNPPGEDIR